MSTRHSTEALKRAEAFLEDRTGYAEAARSVGISRNILRRHFPGMGLDDRESASLVLSARKIAERALARGIDLTELAKFQDNPYSTETK